MLSNSSFIALLKTLEEPPAHVVFILATTEAHKLPATIISRTQRFDFKRVKKEDIIFNLKNIAEKEGIEIDAESLDLIAVSAQGGHRDAIGFLEKISSSTRKIDKALTQSILGIAEMNEVLQFIGAIFNYNPEEGLKIAHRLYENGVEMRQFNQSALEILRKILLFKMSGNFLFEDTEENLLMIEKLSLEKTKTEIVKLINIFMACANSLKDVSYPILPIEIAVVEATAGQNQEARIMNQGKEQTADKKTELNNKDQIQQEQKIENIIEAESKPEIQKKESHDSSSVIHSPALPDAKHLRTGDSNTVPAPVYQMTGDIWEKVINLVKKENSTLAALLRDAKPIEVTDKEVIIGVKFPFHKDRISESKNSKILEKTYCTVTGNNCIIKCRIIKSALKIKDEKVSDDDLQKAAEEVFS
jgi:DNA polymerase-3 subunit gamma/tau